MIIKLSTEEKAIIDYVESGRAVSVAKLENEKKRYSQIAATQMSKKKVKQGAFHAPNNREQVQ